jgi:hypothetical protein
MEGSPPSTGKALEQLRLRASAPAKCSCDVRLRRAPATCACDVLLQTRRRTGRGGGNRSFAPGSRGEGGFAPSDVLSMPVKSLSRQETCVTASIYSRDSPRFRRGPDASPGSGGDPTPPGSGGDATPKLLPRKTPKLLPGKARRQPSSDARRSSSGTARARTSRSSPVRAWRREETKASPRWRLAATSFLPASLNATRATLRSEASGRRSSRPASSRRAAMRVIEGGAIRSIAASSPRVSSPWRASTVNAESCEGVTSPADSWRSRRDNLSTARRIAPPRSVRAGLAIEASLWAAPPGATRTPGTGRCRASGGAK